jgi:hypothetical protein
MGQRNIKDYCYDFYDYLRKSEKHLLNLPDKVRELEHTIESLEEGSAVRQACEKELISLRKDRELYRQRSREYLALMWVIAHNDPSFTDYTPANYERSGQRSELIRKAIKEFGLTCTVSTFQTWLDRAEMPNCAIDFKIG